MLKPRLPICLRLSPIVAALFISGCASSRQIVRLPYEMPASRTTVASLTAPSAIITTVGDARDNLLLNQFLDEPPTDFLRKALAAELLSSGAFSQVTPRPEGAPPHRENFVIEMELRDVSWAVPNHGKIVKTAFWASFLTGGIGGLAYGSTETPVYGHAAIGVKLTARATGKVLLDETLEATCEEKAAKLKCDTPTTQSRVMAAALRNAVKKSAAAMAPKVSAQVQQP
jgi:hypothetical protein